MDVETRRALRLLKLYSTVATSALAVLALAAFRQEEERPRFEEIDVERINVIEADGRPRLVISNAERAPDVQIGGKHYARSGGNSAGLVFYNDEGDEDGGLVYRGRASNGSHRASAGLLFDQYAQDQVVGVTYSDDGERRAAGLYVWDRPDRPVTELADRLAELRARPEGEEKERALATFAKEVEEGHLAGVQRVSVGRTREADAAVVLCDGDGRPRLRIAVSREGEAAIEVLDEQGQSTARFPEQAK